jgi:hypothetical protein
VTPLAKCDMASLKRASSIGIANLRAAQCNATFGATARVAFDVIKLRAL